jgi:hypothetical protein
MVHERKIDHDLFRYAEKNSEASFSAAKGGRIPAGHATSARRLPSSIGIQEATVA